MTNNVLSLFDGISCGQLALQRAGIKIDNYFASEIDKYAIKVTQSNFPETIQLGDVTKVKGKDLPKIDLLIGGSPCQGFSFAGKGLNFDDPRSKLFFEFVRLLKECKPKYFLLENVRMKKEYQDIISENLGVIPIRINSQLLSAAKRDRLYWTNIPNVGHIKDKKVSFDDINSNSQDWISSEKIYKISNWKAKQKPLKNATLIGSKGKLPCLTARGYNQYHSGMILISNGSRYRYLTNEEAEQAQTIPSRMIGNAWTVDVVAHIFRGLLDD